MMAFANVFLEYREEALSKWARMKRTFVFLVKLETGTTTASEGDTDKYDRTSITILISSLLLVSNPPAHATVLFSTPCAPQYWRSPYFSC
jgi:hypothetical protein